MGLDSGRLWAAVGIAVGLVVAFVIVWNTAYAQGRADGITQVGCVQQAQSAAQSSSGCFR